jgi:hypothetical protein
MTSALFNIVVNGSIVIVGNNKILSNKLDLTVSASILFIYVFPFMGLEQVYKVKFEFCQTE